MEQIRQALPHGRARTPCFWAAVAVTALLAAACSSSPSSTGATSATSTSSAGGSANSQQVAYSGCVRSHGVPNFPDPPSSGKFVIPSAQQLGVSSSQLQAAESACQSQRANSGGGEPTAALLQQQRRDMTTFAKCMRSHGVPNWPDPTAYPPDPQRPAFDVRGIDTNSPQITAKAQQCMSLQNIPSSQSGYIERFYS